MFPIMLAVVIMTVLAVKGQKTMATTENQHCKDPTVVQRLMADDVRYASPFYVIALPRTPKTEQMDNVCYTYYETGGAFFHIISVVYKNGNNTYYTFSKSDIPNRVGLAEGIAEKTSSCVYHDYTLTPICNVTVFVLYRCYIKGDCDDIDIGITKGVDVRVVLAASPHIDDVCRLETKENLKDTFSLAGGDYVILPQRHKPQCVTKYNNMTSINAEKAVGSLKLTEEDVMMRFGENSSDLEFTGTTSIKQNSSDKLTTVKDESSLDLTTRETTTTKSNHEVITPLLSSQPTAQTKLPKKTYAEAVKTG